MGKRCVVPNVLLTQTDIQVWEEAEEAAYEKAKMEIAIKEIERLENATLEELDEMEDDLDEDAFDKYRAKRMEEMREQAAREKFGTVFRIGQTDYKQTVACPGDYYVVCLLYGADLVSRRLQHYLDLLAPKFREVKFVEIKATAANPDYPEGSCPTMLVYRDGKMLEQVVGPVRLGGSRVTCDEFEFMLGQRNIIKSSITDPTARKQRSMFAREVDSDDSGMSDFD